MIYVYSTTRNPCAHNEMVIQCYQVTVHPPFQIISSFLQKVTEMLILKNIIIVTFYPESCDESSINASEGIKVADSSQPDL